MDSVTVVIPTIVADKAMLDQAILCVRWTAPDAEIIVPQGGSFAENCNEGARRASGDILIFLNDDTQVQPGWWQPLVRALNDGHMIAGSHLIYPDGRTQHGGVYFTVDNGYLMGHHFLTRREPGLVDAVTGACLAIKTEVFEHLDGFDEGFVNGNEDVDLCFRARHDGGTIWYCADSTVVHHESASGPARWSHVGDNIRRLNEKWSAHVS